MKPGAPAVCSEVPPITVAPFVRPKTPTTNGVTVAVRKNKKYKFVSKTVYSDTTPFVVAKTPTKNGVMIVKKN